MPIRPTRMPRNGDEAVAMQLRQLQKDRDSMLRQGAPRMPAPPAAPAAHEHAVEDVTGLEDALDALTDADNGLDGRIDAVEASLPSKASLATTDALDGRLDVVEAALPGKASTATTNAMDTRLDVLETHTPVYHGPTAPAVAGPYIWFETSGDTIVQVWLEDGV